LEQSSNLILPRQPANELIEMQSCIGRGEDVAVNVEQLHVGDNAHWVYHRDDALGDLNPVPSQACVTVATEPAPHGVP
jgi:hypothetical protein